MTISFDDYSTRVRASKPAQERIQQLRAQIHEAVRASAVTGDANWDHFLSKIEGRISAYQNMLCAEKDVLCHPETVNVDKIMAVKIKIVALEASAQALREIIELPKMIIALGAESRERLDAIEPTDPRIP